MIPRRFFNIGAAMVLALAASVFAGAPVQSAEMKKLAPALSDDGLYHYPWFLESFLNLKEDLSEATDAGKRFVIFWEQKGCPYCREMQTVNMADPKTNKYIRDNFVVLQLNLWGSRAVTDLDGQKMEERALARKWGVIFTPTIMFFDDDVKAATGKSLAKSEVARMPGYFKPFHFNSMFEYVKARAYKKLHFQKFLQAKGDRLREQGKEVKLW